jgi:hypothetical protein
VNLVLLVEGAQTEPLVYEAWLQQRLPALRRVHNVADLTTDGYVLVVGGGNPSYVRRLAALLRDIDDLPGTVQALWICVDSEEATYEQRYEKVSHALAEGKVGTRLATTNPTLEVRILVQHCCIETWFLGHEGFARGATQSRDVVDFRRFFDVSTGDPEEMSKGLEYPTRQSLHLAYLKAMLAEHEKPYTKRNPGIVLDPSYLDALDARCARTGHMGSFRKLLSALFSAGPPVEMRPPA